MDKPPPFKIDPITASRITYLREPGEIKCGHTEFGMLLDLALQQLEQTTAIDHNVEALRTSLAEENKRLEKMTRLYSEAQQTIDINKRDLATQDNYVLSLGRRLREAVAREHAIHEFQSHFVAQVHSCIDRQPLSAACAEHPALLRLQEALPERSIIPAKT